MEKKYDNGEVTVIWKPDLCIHSANCVRGLPGVFNNKARPWIDINGADTESIVAQVKKCPSGALSFVMNNAAPEQEATDVRLTQEVQITTTLNGPLMVEGEVHLVNADGQTIPTKRKVFLCRCGQSSNKPFCDGSHKAAGFQAG
jgi:uncharacterized Fe-S cluster protein YjdI